MESKAHRNYGNLSRWDDKFFHFPDGTGAGLGHGTGIFWSVGGLEHLDYFSIYIYMIIYNIYTYIHIYICIYIYWE